MEQELRNIDWAIFYRLFAIAAQRGWWYTKIGIPLKVLDANDPQIYTVDKPFPLVFFNSDLTLNPSGVTVYVDGNPIPSGNLTIDYINCQIAINPAPSGTITADLAMHTVRIIESYPENEELEEMELPVIAYQMERSDSTTFSLGYDLRFRQRYVTVDMLARNRGECKDLVDDFARFLTAIPLYDMTNHRPLNENFGLDWDWNPVDQYVERLNIIGGIKGTLLRPRPGGSDKERNRALIAFEVERVS